jgi:hypothetical protein
MTEEEKVLEVIHALDGISPALMAEARQDAYQFHSVGDISVNEVYRKFTETPGDCAMTAEQSRKVRDVLRALDGQLDELLIRVRYGEPTGDGKNPARELEKLVGTEQAKDFLQDVIDDAAKRRKTTIRALIAQEKTREHRERGKQS